MIATKAVAPKAEFEALLDKVAADLKTALTAIPNISNAEFENAVLRSMKNAAKGTPFEGEIEKTEERAFPDIAVQGYYGVEVKKTTKAGFKVAGNSIFETSRVSGIEEIYVLISSPSGIKWMSLADVVGNIVVTHSPRYAIDFDLTESVFDKMNLTYEDFRALNQMEKMEKIKTLYENRTLWWLSQAEGITYRFLDDLSKEEKEELITEILFVCPEVFSKHQDKFRNATIYALGQGIIMRNVRDLFTAGGQVIVCGHYYPGIYRRLNNSIASIEQLARDGIDTETLSSFWGVSPYADYDDRFEQWKSLVKQYSSHNLDDILN